jgi:hypothetical protein
MHDIKLVKRVGTFQSGFDLGFNKEFDAVFGAEDIRTVVDEGAMPFNLEALPGEPGSVVGDEAVVSLSHASDTKESLQV